MKHYLILFVICISLVLIWFSKGLIFAGGEEGMPFYNLELTYRNYSYVWKDAEGGISNYSDILRVPSFYILQKLSSIGLSSVLIQGTFFLALMLIGTFSVFFLLQETVVKGALKVTKDTPSYKDISLIGSIFYLLNPFAMTQVWGRGLYMQYYPFALIPLFLLLFILALKTRNLIFVSLALVSSFILAGSYGHLSYVISLWGIIFAYLIYFCINNKSKEERTFSVKIFLLFVVGWIFTNLWWIMPFSSSINTFAQNYSDIEHSLGTLIGNSREIPLNGVLRLMHNGFVYKWKIYGESYLNLFFKLISWFIPIISLFALRSCKNIKSLNFYLVLFLITLFISLGSNPPLGWLFIILFKAIPQMVLYRNPFEKIGILLTIAYAPLFAVGLVELSKFISNKLKKSLDFLRITHISNLFILISMILIFGIHAWPMWKGVFAGGYVTNVWINVPKYYKQANNWLNEETGEFNLIHFPLAPGDGMKFIWPNYFQGVVPYDFLFDRPSISKNTFFNKIYYNVLLERFGKLEKGAFGPDPDISNSQLKTKDLYEGLQKLNVRYILLHKDVDPVIGNLGDYRLYEEILKKEENITKIINFGEIDIYEVTPPEKVDLIFTSQGKVDFEKINPTEYVATLKGVKKDDKLVLLTLYDPNWSLYVNGMVAADHNRYFSWANSWTLDKLGDYSVTIKYKPQENVQKGFRISIFLLSLLLFTTFIYRWKERSDKLPKNV
ncbi:hypothetical protein A2715_04995 [Candidatus Woesebacteria bacterium RIFCSPHIGHO2_01_FULL_39_32]|uniref:Alpha-(1->3)-arabinofuranosyltransferase N-terminal GT-C domain-containing protein n=1 Tax=Candidatus Woesebacteria bacterium RIFCSPLOWO2_01_FULL_39_25 TaxID=1802521 RepID=A0A1F8BLF9_9BACT|nr:MAG: hypothetical protein A2124_00720 [Candidatus Woesebacteria bacterium GWB1_37_5]OGM25376.1 MAG: hypothetical protein A2715_04995 [Candidatus Woesebacteria bacterium RIFCSPHIGHO2_01_FULL_39_32]OGM38484.1 MAG: hypothetical protein A3F01_03950 [Candidatus Woesebacteria bacterium RIFCSPHIGHO2_12_FULL_38_11]OGM64907.1 MAG: hypothetical protein A2893_04605 [Candidatus Woesebacteria bacterium RIFCSPLOWO2_01_FULL_39_25]